MSEERKWRPYIDRGRPGSMRYGIHGRLLEVREPERVHVRITRLEDIRRHNTLEPPLQETNRILLRWSESGGTGLPNPEAETRVTHYDPLPPDLREKVDEIVDASPWRILTVKWYRTTLVGRELAEEMCISRAQLYADVRAALWYYTGRFQSERIYA